MVRYKVSVVFGTRPEAIKLAPVVLALKSDARFECQVCVTGQHRQMLDQVLQIFGIQPDSDLNLMQPGQTLAGLTSRALAALDQYFAAQPSDLILVQGDTTTVFCAALAAFYRKIPVGHVEAGLRTYDLKSPWPEEANRVLTSRLTTLHFAPAETARQNLWKEGVADAAIFVTGNTVIDALLWMRNKLGSDSCPCDRRIEGWGLSAEFSRRFLSNGAGAHLKKRIRRAPNAIPGPIEQCGKQPRSRLILVTGHRRESFGRGFEDLCSAIRRLVKSHDDVGVVYPVHLNPQVQEPVRRILGNHPRIQLIAPLGYEDFIWLMDHSFFILSDSGGVQEEAPSLGKPVLVMRDTTERPEGIAAGTCRLVGTNPEVILREANLLLENESEYLRRSRLRNPYGDGRAAERIVKACAEFLAED